MKLINFLNSSEFNQLRLNMGANLVQKTAFNYTPKSLILVNSFKCKADNSKIQKKIKKNNLINMQPSNRPYDPGYSKDNLSPNIFHPIKQNTK